MRVEDFSPQLIADSPGVYLMKGEDGEVLYIGKAKCLRHRLASYFKSREDSRKRIPFLMKRVKEIDTILVSNETEALLLENNLIKKHHPKYNVLLKDDKTFFCLAISEDPWPRIEAVRTRALTSKKQKLFGPYVSSEACHTLLDVISQWFPLRSCSNREFACRKRPCILYEMKRCLAPCVQKCSKEEYQAVVHQAILFLSGKEERIIRELKQLIQSASDEQRFEQAAAHYRTLIFIQQALSKQHVECFSLHHIDVIGLFRKTHQVVVTLLSVRSGKLLGARHFLFSENAQEDADLLTSFLLQYYSVPIRVPEEILLPISLDMPDLPHLICQSRPPKIKHPRTGYGKELLNMAYRNACEHARVTSRMSLPYDELKELLHSSGYPCRIECYDVAHCQGSHGVGVMIVFQNDALSPRDYRTFSVSSANDLISLREILSRRLEMTAPPDLIIVDGGSTQYRAAQEVLHQFNLTGIELIAIAKEFGNHSRSLRNEKLFCSTFPQGIHLAPTSKLLQFLQMLRDEAHRFAISKHRKKRARSLFTFEKIPGIGEIKRKRLLQHFKSWRQVTLASREELESIPGLTKKDIEEILKRKS